MLKVIYMDECSFSLELKSLLEKEGFKVKTATTENLIGIDDTIQLGFAEKNKYIFITTDKRLESLLKTKNRPGTFIINQLLIQNKKYKYITMKIKYYLMLYNIDDITNFGYVFKIY